MAHHSYVQFDKSEKTQKNYIKPKFIKKFLCIIHNKINYSISFINVKKKKYNRFKILKKKFVKKKYF